MSPPTPPKSWFCAARVAIALAALIAAPTSAGPPFVTDDPEPTDLHRWEIYDFVAGSHIAGETAGQAGLDINYGEAKNLQLTMVVPLDYSRTTRTDVGLGGIELAAKYRFVQQQQGSLLPDVAFFPRLIVPTADRRFGTNRLDVFLPLWAQKDLGNWSLFGGGGFTINPGVGRRDFWLSGLGLSRTLGKRLSVGAEIYRQTRSADNARPFTGVNVGALYRLNRHWSLIGSAGPGIENGRSEGNYTFYFALKTDY